MTHTPEESASVTLAGNYEQDGFADLAGFRVCCDLDLRYINGR